MEKMENEMKTGGNSCSIGVEYRVYCPPVTENHMDKKMENEMETGGTMRI